MADHLTRGIDAAYPPAPDGAEARDAALRALAREIDGTTRHPRRPRRALVVATGAMAVTLAGAGVVSLVLPGDGGQRLSRADAATVRVLETGADAAERAPAGPVVAPGQYLYTRSRNLVQVMTQFPGGTEVTYLERNERRSWIGEDGSLRLVGDREAVRFLAGDRAAYEAERSRLRAEGPSEDRYAGEDFTTADAFANAGASDADLAERHEDPEAAADLLREAAGRYGGKDAVDEMFVMVGDGLRESDLSPRARAALFRAAAYIPGVVADGEARDSAGRTGIAVSREQDGIRQELIFDPRTAALLEERSIVTGPVDWLPGVATGTVIGRGTYLERGVVNSDTATP